MGVFAGAATLPLALGFWAAVVAFCGFFAVVSGITRIPHSVDLSQCNRFAYGLPEVSAFGAEKPIRFYFAFVHKPLVMAWGVCCLHSSSVKKKSGTHTQKAMNAMNIVPMISF